MKRALCLLLAFAMLMPNFTVFAAAEETQPAVTETVEAVLETEEIVEETEETAAETAEETTVEETVLAETTVVTEAVEETTVVTEAAEETSVPTEPLVETTAATEPVVETTVATEPVVETTAATEAVEETVTEEAQVTEEAVQETVAEIPELRQEGTSFYFYTFAQLQQIAAGTYAEWTDAYYDGTEDLVIAEDLTLPENLSLSTYGTGRGLVIPEGVTFYNNHRLYADTVTVDGVVYSTADIHINVALTVNGTLHMEDTLNIYEGAVLTGRENVTFTQESGGIHKNLRVASESELMAAVDTVHGETDPQVYYNLFVAEPVVLEQSVTIPENCSLSVQDGITITVNAGCTLTVDTYFPMQCALIVEGTIVNNREFGVHEKGSITLQNGGSYSGEGNLWVSNSNIADPFEVLVGFDLTDFEVSSDNGYWDLKYVGHLIKLSDPTDLQWGIARDVWAYNPETQQFEVMDVVRPGSWALKYGEIYQGEMDINIYREGSEESLGSWGGTTENAGSWYTGDLMFLDDIESGNYYFNAIMRGDYETYCDSNLVTSPVYSYTKPAAQLETCMKLTWDGTQTSYIGPSDTTYVDGYQFLFFYASEEGGELVQVQKTWNHNGPDSGIQTIGDWITGEYGAGYYYYQVRALSSDIEQYCNGDLSELSTAYYYDGSAWTEPEIPDVPVEPEVTEPEETTTGTCGENLSWTFDEETGLLHIFGTGAMYDYNPGDNTAPWAYKNVTAVQIDEGVTSIGNFAFFCCHSLQSVSIADSVTKIGADAFHCCCSLTEITLPANLQEMYGAPFLACRELKSIQISGDNTAFKTVDGVLFTKDGKSLVAYPAGNTQTSYTVPAGVETIGANAFAGSFNLKTVTFPNSVAFVGENAFYNCYNLQKIDLGTNLRQIGPWAFNCCEALQEITIPGTVTTIENLAFGHCTALTKITFQGAAPAIYNESSEGMGPAFFGVTAKAYYPVAADGWSTAKQNYGGTLTWVAYGDLQAPTVKVTNRASDGKPSLSWNAVEGALEYQVWSSTTGKTGSFKRLITVEKTSHVHAKAETGTKYYYKVRAVGADGIQSDFSDVVSRISDLAQPKIDAFARADNGKIKINWDKVTGAVKYQVYRATSKTGTYSRIATVTGVSYADNDVSVNKLYYYKVRAVYSNTDANSAYSEIDSARCILPRPTVTLSTVDTSGKVKITWKAVTGAAKYEVYRSTKKDSGYSKIATTTNLNATDTSGTAGTTYYYKVKAIHSNTNASSAYSVAKSRLVKLAQPVVKATNITDSGKVHLSWDKVAGASKYYIYRATSKTGTYKHMWTVTGTSYNNIFQIEAGKTYYYKVKAIHENTDANSIFSEIVSRTCKLEQPEIKITIVRKFQTKYPAYLENQLKISWSKISGAKSYQVYRATSKNGTYKRLDTITATNYTDVTVEAGTTYYYKVRALHTVDDAKSAYSEVVSKLCTLAYPASVHSWTDGETGRIKVSWHEVEHTKKYEVYRATKENGTYTYLKTVTGTGFTDSANLKVGSTYYYKIKAVHSNTKANSALSSSTSGTRRLPTPTYKWTTLDSKDRLILNWYKVDGAVCYYIYRSTSKNGYYEKVGTSFGTSYNTKTKTNYYYKIQARYTSKAGHSAYENCDGFRVN